MSAPSSPPLRVDSTLQLAWGLTLNLSHEANQVKIGQAFLEYLRGLKEQHRKDPTASSYLDNLECMLGAYLRSMGFERDVFVKGLNIIDGKRDERIKSINAVHSFIRIKAGRNSRYLPKSEKNR